MTNVTDAYCAVEDLRIGDIAPPSHTTLSQYVSGAAEEIDAAIGHLYVTPLVIAALPENRPSILALKKVNWLLASGRCVLDIAAAGEMDNLHAYGQSMLAEAKQILKALVSESITLVGAEKIVPTDIAVTGPIVINEDEVSLVETFYQDGKPDMFGLRPREVASPYGNW